MTNRNKILYLVLVVTLLIAWEFASSWSNTTRLLVSSPTLIIDFFSAEFEALLVATWVTLLEAIVGLAIAIVFSFSVMIMCFYNKSLLEFLLPIMIFSQVIPLITLAPLFIMLFGIGMQAKIIMAAVMCFFPIFVNFSNGVTQIDQGIHDLFDIYNASVWKKIMYVYFPLSTPQIISGIKVASTLSVIGAIVAEFNGAETGLGKNLFISAKRLEPELMMSSLFLASLIGGSMYLLIVLIERRIGKWYLK